MTKYIWLFCPNDFNDPYASTRDSVAYACKADAITRGLREIDYRANEEEWNETEISQVKDDFLTYDDCEVCHLVEIPYQS